MTDPKNEVPNKAGEISSAQESGIKSFSVPKYEGLNEDYSYIPNDPGSPVVLCDGASESFNSRIWAELLSKSLKRHDDFTDSWLKDRIAEYEAAIDFAELSWSKQLAYERGSFSTFLSVQITDGKCLINAVGDTVAFLVADGMIIDTYPYAHAEEFLGHPDLLSTKPELNTNLEEPGGDRPFSGHFELNNECTHILLLTDAIAHWLMKRKSDKDALCRLLEIETEVDFSNFVEEERQNDLRFDDTTMIRIDVRKVDLRTLLPMLCSGSLPACS